MSSHSPRWKKRPDNAAWGEFGPDDQLGRMNLITPALRLKAFQEVREGIAFCLSLPLDYPGGSALFPYRKPPELHTVPRGNASNYNYVFSNIKQEYTDVFCDDAVTLFTQYSTQWDALGHCGGSFDADDDGVAEIRFYNGYKAGTDIVGPEDPRGPYAHALGVENLAAACVQGRGVMVNFYAVYGENFTLIGYEELMRVLEAQKAVVEEGDFLCMHTGMDRMLLKAAGQPDPKILRRACAALNGRDGKLLQWITDSKIVAICADNLAVEAHPSEPCRAERYADLPLHEHCLFKTGVYLAEMWYLAELADWLQAAGRNRFLLTAPPLRLPGAVGSPVTPVATV